VVSCLPFPRRPELRRQHQPVNKILGDDTPPLVAYFQPLKRSNERLLAFDDDEKAGLPLPALQSRPLVPVDLLCDSYL